MHYKYYLPEYHDFDYIALAPWPNYDSQIDWVDNVTTLELWLEQYVGRHYQSWAWATNATHDPSLAAVAFKWDKHRTLFLLAWA